MPRSASSCPRHRAKTGRHYAIARVRILSLAEPTPDGVLYENPRPTSIRRPFSVIPVRDDPGEPRRSFPWVMLTILVVNVLLFVFELGVGSTASLDNLFLEAGIVPVEFTRGVLVGPPPPFGMTWTTLFTSMFLHGGF